MLNVEVKVRLDDLGAVRRRAQALGAKREGVLRQTDTYFHAPHGRLKLREMRAGGTELIAYDRPDQPGGRVSDYRIVPVERPAELKAALIQALGVRVIVTKER